MKDGPGRSTRTTDFDEAHDGQAHLPVEPNRRLAPHHYPCRQIVTRWDDGTDSLRPDHSPATRRRTSLWICRRDYTQGNGRHRAYETPLPVSPLPVDRANCDLLLHSSVRVEVHHKAAPPGPHRLGVNAEPHHLAAVHDVT